MNFHIFLLLASATAVAAFSSHFEFSPQELDQVKAELKDEDGITLLHHIGSGGMASVYAATFANGSSLAVKLSRSTGSEDENWDYATNAELFCLEQTSHRALMKHLGDSFFTFPGYNVSAIFVELLGPNLHKLLARDDATKGLSAGVVFHLAGQISEGLAHLHGQFIAHHDIKPLNMVIDGQLNPNQPLKAQLFEANFKIIDISLCEVYKSQDDLESFPLGTPKYYSPEKANHGKPYNPFLADAYALGYSLVEALLGPRVQVSMMMKVQKQTGLHYSKITISEIYAKYRSFLPANQNKLPLFQLIANLLEADPAKRMTVIEFNRQLQH